MPTTSDRAAPPATNRSLRLQLGAVLLAWGLVGMALVLSQTLDAQRAGHSASFWKNLAWVGPLFLPQVAFSLATAWVLHHRRHWLQRPLRLLAVAALGVLPLYLLVATPLVVLLGLVTRGLPLSGFPAALEQWAAINVWVDTMTAGAGLALQIGWAFWQQAQAQREAVLQAQAENLRLRLTLLQGQLEPHFMFNTLNSIAALVRGAERGQALQALNRLSELLRYALRASQQSVVSVDDELRFVDEYVALQRLRFGDALDWHSDVEVSDWARWACPPLLLQPLVENAIRHGLESGPEGALTLRVRKVDGTLVLELDNPRHAEAALMPGHGVGLSKTRERLHVLYGDRAELRTEALPTQFRLRLRLPLEDLDAALEAADR